MRSTFLIDTPLKVPLHYNRWRRENIIVNRGRALMKLGIDTFTIQKGDQVTILKGTPHEVIRVLSRKSLKVYSIQSPKFDASDRYFVQPK